MDSEQPTSTGDIAASQIYTPIDEACSEIIQRYNDKNLKKKIEDFFGRHMLAEMNHGPRAVLSRSIATPNMELAYFLEMADKIKLQPLFLEYHDKFVAKNPHKYHLCRLCFFHRSKKGAMVTRSAVRIVNFNEEEGKYFGDVKTMWGDTITDFHHQMLFSQYPTLQKDVVDFSQWFNQTRILSGYYYLYFLSLFICHGILFEDYLFDDKEENAFIKDRLLPGFLAVQKLFGLKPLICRLLPNTENDRYWYSYSNSIKKTLDPELSLLLKK